MSEDPKSRRSSSNSFGSASGGYHQPALFDVGSLICYTYRVEALLARGGMGEVYKTRHTEIGTEHAIKIVRPDLASSEKIMELFRREASVLRTVRDDAIVGYDGVLRDEEGRVYLVMEFVDGPSLTSFVEDRVLSLQEVRRLRDRLARGLAAAHDKGVIHRDMSPDNIILGHGDLAHAKIIDFGIAKLADSSATTIIGDDFAGRYAYASPEQIGLYGGQVDARSDVYSLGLVLATAATGKALNMGEISESLVSVIEARKRIPDFSSVPPELRPELGSMLEPDPADRPQSMREVIGLDQRLRDAAAMAATAAEPEPAAGQAGESKAAEPLAAEPAARPSAGGQEGQRRWLVPALAAVIAVIAAGGYFVWQERDAAPAAPVAQAPLEAAPAETTPVEAAPAAEQAAPPAAPVTAVAEAPGTATGEAGEPLAEDEVAPAGEAAAEAPLAIEPPALPTPPVVAADEIAPAGEAAAEALPAAEALATEAVIAAEEAVAEAPSAVEAAVPAATPEAAAEVAAPAEEEATPAEQVATLPEGPSVNLQTASLQAAEGSLSADDRREIQRDLRALGHYRGAIDGSFGQGTRAGIESYQKVAGVEATGYLLPETRTALAGEAAPARAEEQRLAAEKAAAEALAAQQASAERAAAEAAAARAQAAAQARQPAVGTQQAALPNESEVDRLARQAEAGDVLAQASLGQRYYRGDGVRRDLAEAARWTLRAAEQGEARAQSNLGFYYMKGEGVDRDPAAAARWWRAAADQGLPQAQYNLGVLYEQGQGVTVDYLEAAKWYALAAAQGDRNAAERLAALKRRDLIPAGN